MFVIVKVPVDDASAKCADMKELLTPKPAGYVHCCDAAVSESAEDVRKATRLDGVDAFTYAIRALFERKDDPGFKNALDGIYGTARDVASIDLEQMYPKKLENVKDDEPNALFVTIETDTFGATPENVEAVNSFISNVGEGRDIHLRII